MAFQEFVQLYQQQVYQVVWGFVKNAEDAEDLSQEVFLEAFRSLASFRGQAKISTWLYRIAANKGLEHIRRSKRKKRFAFLQSLGENRDEVNPPTYDHPGIVLENRERARILHWAISQLPDKQQIAFTLHKLDGMSHQEISEVMTLSISAVESLIFRARRNLRNKLQHYYRNKLL